MNQMIRTRLRNVVLTYLVAALVACLGYLVFTNVVAGKIFAGFVAIGVLTAIGWTCPLGIRHP